MTSQNESVIICESPSPSRSNCRNSDVTNYRKRLRSCNSKNLLHTVYESPLIHLHRNVGQQEAESDGTVVLTPPAKRAKVGATSTGKKDSNQSIVVVDDATGDRVVEIVLSDIESEVVELKRRTIRTRSCKAKTSTVSTPLKGRRKRTRIKKQLENAKAAATGIRRSNVNDENRNGQIMERNMSAPETEDIEVLWVSGASAEFARRDEDPSERCSFIVDKEPSFANLSRKSLQRAKKVQRLVNDATKQQNAPKRKGRNGTLGRKGNRDVVTVLNGQTTPQKKKLREIVIDGCNVAMGHKNGTGFSEKGLQIVIDYFKERGHAVHAFLPQYMRKGNRTLLEKLHTNGDIVFTPSRKIGGKDITPYDDRFILEYATKCNGIVVSSDQYRDLWREKPQWRDTIENRLLAPTFVGDYLMFPEDPLGRDGPKLEDFLRH